jgi:muramoyltetrapeptide carboxypeptidase
MIQPPFLVPGDTIGIAATARKVSAAELQPAVQLLESWGLTIRLSSTLFAEDNQFGGTDKQRTLGLQELLDDTNVKAIIIVRGGYGTVRIIDELNFSLFQQNPKWIIGFSDITVLHSHIHRHFGIQTLHGPMTLNMMPERFDAPSIEALRKALMGEEIQPVITLPHVLSREGKATGQLVGGNLSVLYSLLGSGSDIDTKGKILFLEDLDEYLYHIDRMMQNLKRNGKLDQLSGLVIGQMSDMKDNATPFGKNAEEIIIDTVKEYHFPVCFGFPAGHEKRNISMKFGAMVKFSVHKDGASLEWI